jgi:type I restriction enzyme R subunit
VDEGDGRETRKPHGFVAVVARVYTKQVYVDKACQQKTNALVQKHVQSSPIAAVTDFIAIDAQTIDLIKQ